jgi:hypothetical protein
MFKAVNVTVVMCLSVIPIRKGIHLGVAFLVVDVIFLGFQYFTETLKDSPSA